MNSSSHAIKEDSEIHQAINPAFAHHVIKCKYCEIILAGKEQFIGHMFHMHEFDYSQLKKIWDSIELYPGGKNQF